MNFIFGLFLIAQLNSATPEDGVIAIGYMNGTRNYEDIVSSLDRARLTSKVSIEQKDSKWYLNFNDLSIRNPRFHPSVPDYQVLSLTALQAELKGHKGLNPFASFETAHTFKTETHATDGTKITITGEVWRPDTFRNINNFPMPRICRTRPSELRAARSTRSTQSVSDGHKQNSSTIWKRILRSRHHYECHQSGFAAVKT